MGGEEGCVQLTEVTGKQITWQRGSEDRTREPFFSMHLQNELEEQLDSCLGDKEEFEELLLL